MSTRRVTRAASSRASSVAASDIGSELTSTTRTPRRSGRNLPPVNPRENILGPAYHNYENQENPLTTRDDEETSQVGRRAGLRSSSRNGSRVGGSRAATMPGPVLATPGNNDNSNSFGLESSVFGNINSNQTTPAPGNSAISPIHEVVEPPYNSRDTIIEPPRFQSAIDPFPMFNQQVQPPSLWRKVKRGFQVAYQHTVFALWKVFQWLFKPLPLIILLILGVVTFALMDPGHFTEPFKLEIQKSLSKFCTGYIPPRHVTYDTSAITEIHKRMKHLEREMMSLKISAHSLDEKAALKLAPLVHKYQLEYERNMAKIMRRVNHFSANNGAIINPYTTSPSYQFSSQRANIFWRALHWAILDPLPSPKPPVEALSNWDESGDCWCSPAQGSGSGVRLGVLLPNYIYPDEIVIEHVHQSATLDPGAAPEKMELYAKLDHKEAWKISDDSITLFGPYDDRGFDETYIKLAEWEYIAEASNNVQVFPLQVMLDRYRISTRELVVIALNNSGNIDHTCLYRVLLHGQVDK